MPVSFTRWASPISALAELLSTQRTIAVEAFAAVKIESIVVIQAGENVAVDGSLVERGPSVGAVASNLIAQAIVCGHDNVFMSFSFLVSLDNTERCGVVEFE